MNIAIIGKDSYIGNSLSDYITRQGYNVFLVDALNEKWKEFDFSNIDSVICVAAIVHRKDITDYSVYHKINTLMPVEIAQKIKTFGVKQFVFLSSMAVFGQTKKLDGNVISDPTACTPIDHYGKSKFEAEKLLLEEQTDNFNVCIVRPANVYGKNCKGNYMPYFKKLSNMLPVIPSAYEKTHQGLIYIDNLCHLIYLALKNSASGIYHAQDGETVSTSQLLSAISAHTGKKKKSSRAFGFIFKVLRISITNKLFGGVVYSEDLAKCNLGDYQIISFEEAIHRTFN